MKPRAIPLTALALTVLMSGCTSNEPPAWAREWAKQKIAEDQLAQQKQAQAAQKRAELLADFRQRAAELERTKADYMKRTTSRIQSDRQEALGMLGFDGHAVYLEEIDVAIVPEKGLQLDEIAIVWLSKDYRAGGVVKGYCTTNLVTSEISDLKFESNRTLTENELVEIHKELGIGRTAQASQSTPAGANSPSFYERNQKTIDNAVIGLGASTLGLIIENWMHSSQ